MAGHVRSAVSLGLAAVVSLAVSTPAYGDPGDSHVVCHGAFDSVFVDGANVYTEGPASCLVAGPATGTSEQQILVSYTGRFDQTAECFTGHLSGSLSLDSLDRPPGGRIVRTVEVTDMTVLAGNGSAPTVPAEGRPTGTVTFSYQPLPCYKCPRLPGASRADCGPSAYTSFVLALSFRPD